MSINGTLTVELEFPLKIKGGKEVNELTFTLPTVRQMLAAEKQQDESKAGLELMASACGLTADDFLDMNSRDFATVSRQFANFTQPEITG